MSTSEQRKAEVKDVRFDMNYHRPVPPNALVLRQYQRGLKRQTCEIEVPAWLAERMASYQE